VQNETSRRLIFDHQLPQKSFDFACMRRVLRIGLFISFCWVLSGNTAGAQQSTAATSKPGPTNPVPTPIHLTEIAPRAQSTIKSLRDIEVSLSTDQTITTVEKRLPQLTEEIDSRTAEDAKLLTVESATGIASPPKGRFAEF